MNVMKVRKKSPQVCFCLRNKPIRVSISIKGHFKIIAMSQICLRFCFLYQNFSGSMKYFVALSFDGLDLDHFGWPSTSF